ncbi:FecCD family ABC transporter permease [Marinobacter sp. F4206]|uniref:FecCD family ABC transporter permease n=1 Tax=Marinobacter sp. F4206 TaxID=2861777 RepID=UPI001C5D4316|nr:iron ABC transporter permease [Marinobacter sp. F4206]MBW4935559.1 iron ABC transporter permease [Marinobacter sp. F4206]
MTLPATTPTRASNPGSRPSGSSPVARLFLAGGLGVAIVLVAGVQLGAIDLSWAQVWAGLTGDGSEHVQRVIFELRLPRTLTGVLIGIHFALSGWLLQLLSRNPLAEAGILGISAGASLVAVVAFIIGDWLVSSANPYDNTSFALQYLPLFAMAGGLVTALAVYFLGMRHGHLSPVKMTLTGAVIAGMLHALTTGALAFWGHAHTELVAQWLAGSLYGVEWDHLHTLLPWTFIGLAGVALLVRPLKVMQLDDEHVRTLGLVLNRWRAFALLIATLLAASAVGVVGPVGFIGLLIPHISRRLAGANLPAQLVLCVLLGAVLAVLADLLGRTLFSPYEVPVGVVSAVLGVPFFLYLLSRQP